MSPASTVHVALPVWNGTRFVADAIRAMLDQTHRDLRLQISVDGNDRESAAVCEPFLADPRVRLTVQPERLGWVDNMAWLIERCDGDWFTYWQQDDLVEPTYLERLLEALTDAPGAAGAYSDLRWFEDRSDEVILPSITGFTQARILTAIEALHWLPLRALVPVKVLRRIGPVRGVDGEISCADYLTVLRLAAAGDLVRVPEVLYRKRSHGTSTSHRAANPARQPSRDTWIGFGGEAFAVAAPHFPEADLPLLAAIVCDRFVTPRPGRWFRYDPAAVSEDEPLSVALELYAAMEGAAGRRLRPPVPPGSTDAGMLAATLAGWRAGLRPGERPPRGATEDPGAVPERRGLLDAVHREGRATLPCHAGGAGLPMLLDGWSTPEPWGTWSDGPRARLWLPIPARGERWLVRLSGRGFRGSPGTPLQPRVVASVDGRRVLDHALTDGVPIPDLSLRAPAPGGRDGVVVVLDLPAAASPASLGMGGDLRRLGLGLTEVEVVREGAA